MRGGGVVSFFGQLGRGRNWVVGRGSEWFCAIGYSVELEQNRELHEQFPMEFLFIGVLAAQYGDFGRGVLRVAALGKAGVGGWRSADSGPLPKGCGRW